MSSMGELCMFKFIAQFKKTVESFQTPEQSQELNQLELEKLEHTISRLNNTANLCLFQTDYLE